MTGTEWRQRARPATAPRRFPRYGAVSSPSPATQVASTRTASGSSATMSARQPGARRPSRSDEPEKSGRGGRRQPQRLGQTDAEQAHAVAHRARHVERRAGEHAVFGRNAAVAHGDVLAAQPERAPGAADRRHRVGDEHRVAQAAQRQAQHRRRDMLAVDDQPVERIRVFERRRDRPGVARLRAAASR